MPEQIEVDVDYFTTETFSDYVCLTGKKEAYHICFVGNVKLQLSPSKDRIFVSNRVKEIKEGKEEIVPYFSDVTLQDLESILFTIGGLIYKFTSKKQDQKKYGIEAPQSILFN
jgi:hypothetical protein